ncbi:MAG: rhodanese-like domain-containing protein [Tannerella sp.]|nr:rhodanese-like domain-containing protein [Tannerella sp.]
MANFFGNLFGAASIASLKEKLTDGAVLLDVRTRSEFGGEHAEGSKNIPLDELVHNLSELDENMPVIVVCASGVRSKKAASILKKSGFAEVFNGGSWTNFG